MTYSCHDQQVSQWAYRDRLGGCQYLTFPNIMPLILTGPCYREFQEFPILQINPAFFGFKNDVSNSASIFECPAFATDDGRYRLWCNWPEPAERVLRKPMRRWMITKQDPSIPDPFLDPEYSPAKDFCVTGKDDLCFCSDDTKDLFLHLLTTRYADNLPVLDTTPTKDDVSDWYSYLISANLYFEPDTSPFLLNFQPDVLSKITLYMSNFAPLGKTALVLIARDLQKKALTAII